MCREVRDTMYHEGPLGGLLGLEGPCESGLTVVVNATMTSADRRRETEGKLNLERIGMASRRDQEWP